MFVYATKDKFTKDCYVVWTIVGILKQWCEANSPTAKTRKLKCNVHPLNCTALSYVWQGIGYHQT